MLKKNNLLNTWLWKWHVIAGLITLPFMLLLAITGTIYLFKDNVNQLIYPQQLSRAANTNNATVLPLSQQLSAAQQATTKPISLVTLPASTEQNTAFTLAGKDRATDVIYVDPYTAEVRGNVNSKQTFMYNVRKLHGELLVGKAGSLLIELVASWFIVLILTGLYIWWPKKSNNNGGIFTIRFSSGKRIFWRDIHAVIGFWLSLFMAIILAGGMPWTDVFGSQLKWVQQQTNSGFPAHWNNSNGLQSKPINSISKPLDLDSIVLKAQQYELKGTLTITLPKDETDVYTVANRALLLRDQQVLHIDQYSGEIHQALTWQQVGVLMDLRQVFMRLHQGEYGFINWLVLLIVALLFSLTTIAGLTSYVLRKPSDNWAIPKVPARFKVDKIVIMIIISLGIVFPLFGISLVLITLYSWWITRQSGFV